MAHFNKRFNEQNKLQVSMATALEDIRHEVSSLRLSNKELARQLHNDKYVAKHQAQREVNSLRSENFRVQREIVALRDNISVTTRQAEAREHVARGKQREINEAEMQLDRINTKIKDVQTKKEEMAKSDEILQKEITQIKENIQQYLDESKDLNIQQEDEIGLRKEIESANQKILSDCEKLQARNKARQIESQNIAENNKILENETEKIKQQISEMSQKIKENENICHKLEVDISKIEVESKEKKQQQIIDSDKHLTLLTILQPPPTSSVKVQTETLDLGKNKNIFDKGADKTMKRGTVVRVLGVGGSAKQKFGKDLEVRATSYSRHVQLNVKLNK